MENEYVPYKLALELKTLGFDEKCVAIYNHRLKNPDEVCLYFGGLGYFGGIEYLDDDYGYINSEINGDIIVTAPTWRQVFKWFRDKHKLHGTIVPWKVGEKIEYYFSYQPLGKSTLCRCTSEVTHDSYEGAELACLKKLIEIVKPKTDVI